MKIIPGIAIVILISLFNNTVAAAANTNAGPVRTLQPLKGGTVWEIEESWRFEINHHCEPGEESYGFWPGDTTCSGYLGVYQWEPKPEDPLLAYYERNKPRKTSDEVSVNGKWGASTKLYDVLVALDDPVASFEGRQYRLAEFKERVYEDYRAELEKSKAQVEEHRSQIKSLILAYAAGIFFALVGLFITYKIARRFIPRVASVVRRGVGLGTTKTKGALGDLRDMHVRHVVMDETIRATTRASLDNTQRERAELRAQILQALENGNPELAKTLTSLLQKLEGDMPFA
jgi:hypothetical protein